MPGTTSSLVALIKCLKLRVAAPGGLAAPFPLPAARRDDRTSDLMLRRHPGVSAAGEMLDREVPTRGERWSRLARGRAAGQGVLATACPERRRRKRTLFEKAAAKTSLNPDQWWGESVSRKNGGSK